MIIEFGRFEKNLFCFELIFGSLHHKYLTKMHCTNEKYWTGDARMVVQSNASVIDREERGTSPGFRDSAYRLHFFIFQINNLINFNWLNNCYETMKIKFKNLLFPKYPDNQQT